MLLQLYIKNFALIDELNISFHPGFSVITGETGAGKSIILGALGLILGNRADSKLIKTGTPRCTVEAHFDIADNQLEDFFASHDIDYDPCDCIMRREICTNGKSRAFLNDTPVALSVMKELGEKLIDIHSQHQNLLLGKEDFQLDVIDTMAGNQTELADYQKNYQRYIREKNRLDTLKHEIEERQHNEDFLRFQHEELKKARLEDCSQEQLEQTFETMNHAEEIKTTLYESEQMLSNEQNGVINQTRSIATQLQRLGRIYPQGVELGDRIQSCYIELKDIAQELSSSIDDISFDPAQMEDIQKKLDTIYTLQQKYHVTSVQELLEECRHIEETLSNIENGDQILQEQKQLVEELRSTCIGKAKHLSTLRSKAVQLIEKTLTNDLQQLGMPNVQFGIHITDKELGISGTDKVSFLFTANTNSPMQPISQIASGGEVARVMLALKAMISGIAKLPTIIFDEIDTGVSGRVAESMARIMKKMGETGRQVISITHLPQIAALGETHYKVCKRETLNGTESSMSCLSPSERIDEIAQMLSGDHISQAAKDNAKSLLHLTDSK